MKAEKIIVEMFGQLVEEFNLTPDWNSNLGLSDLCPREPRILQQAAHGQPGAQGADISCSSDSTACGDQRGHATRAADLRLTATVGTTCRAGGRPIGRQLARRSTRHFVTANLSMAAAHSLDSDAFLATKH